MKDQKLELGNVKSTTVKSSKNGDKEASRMNRNTKEMEEVDKLLRLENNINYERNQNQNLSRQIEAKKAALKKQHKYYKEDLKTHNFVNHEQTTYLMAIEAKKNEHA